MRAACILRIQIEVEKILPTKFAFIFRYKDMDSTLGATTKPSQKCEGFVVYGVFTFPPHPEKPVGLARDEAVKPIDDLSAKATGSLS